MSIAYFYIYMLWPSPRVAVLPLGAVTSKRSWVNGWRTCLSALFSLGYSISREVRDLSEAYQSVSNALGFMGCQLEASWGRLNIWATVLDVFRPLEFD